MGAFQEPISVRSRQWLAAPVAVVAAVLALASAAWACAPVVALPEPNQATTYFESCTAPAGATYRCKPVPGTPKFPNATSIQGAAGSTFSAWVLRGLIPGMKYDLQLATKPQRKNGIGCAHPEALVLNGPVVANTAGAIAPTSGTIPANAPLGLAAVCFSDVSYDTDILGGRDPNDATNQNHVSSPAYFKVIL